VGENAISWWLRLQTGDLPTTIRGAERGAYNPEFVALDADGDY